MIGAGQDRSYHGKFNGAFRTRKPLRIKGFELGHGHGVVEPALFIDGKFTGCSPAHPRNKKRY
jgi:hypothetical protein